MWKLKLEFSKAISAAVSNQGADAKALREEIDGRNVEILATIDRADSDVKTSMEADYTAKLYAATTSLQQFETSVTARKTRIEALNNPPCEVGAEITNRMKCIKTTIAEEHKNDQKAVKAAINALRIFGTDSKRKLDEVDRSAAGPGSGVGGSKGGGKGGRGKRRKTQQTPESVMYPLLVSIVDSKDPSTGQLPLITTGLKKSNKQFFASTKRELRRTRTRDTNTSKENPNTTTTRRSICLFREGQTKT